MSKQYYVYIMTNRSGTLYTGVTNNLLRLVYEHKNKLVKGFTNFYNINKLVYYEIFLDSYNAISREKQLKAGSRKNKIELIKNFNPDWNDLYEQILPQFY